MPTIIDQNNDQKPPLVLVTGGAGFIGSHVTCSLAASGARVRVLDDLSTGRRANLDLFGANVEFIQGDIRRIEDVAACIAGVDVVYHLAAMVSVPQSVAEPVRCHEICATGTLNVLQSAQKAGVRRVVYAASSAAYGNASSGSISETHALQTVSPYAAAKLAGELYCQAFAGSMGLETVRLRFFNVYGPRQDPSSPYSGVISIFVDRAKRGETATIFGDGLQTRDFIHVNDIVAALISAGARADVSGGVFNIGSGRPTTLLDLHAAVNRAAGRDLAPRHGPPRVGDVRDSLADISAARQRLGFEPTVSLNEGLQQMLLADA